MAFLKSVKINYKDLLINEIALDGLEGIGLDLLWKRVEKCISSPVTLKLKTRFWKFIFENDSIKFYLLNEPLPTIEILDRFAIVDDYTGHMLDPPDYVDGPYKYCPIKDEFGSCSEYKSRKLLPKSKIELMSYEELETTYGDRLVMVASLEERWRAMACHLPITFLSLLTPVHYCILELIGRARENGQITVGKTNLTKIVSESKLLFYNRKHLLKLDLIRVQYITQVVAGKSMKTILLRLKKYHKSQLQSLPKEGRVYKMVNHLLEQPSFSERSEYMIKQGYMTSKHCKRLQKTFNVFSFEDRSITLDNGKGSNQNAPVKRKYMCLTPLSDDDESDDDADNQTPPLKCQYKVGVNLLRQAYERFLEAGLKGLTQIEMAQLLGVEFYTSRSICRTFRARNIIREFLEDKGRQRTARYVAIAATKEMDKKYADEKRKFLKYYDDSITEIKKKGKRAAEIAIDDENKIAAKKSKSTKNEDTPESAITETASLSGLEGSYGSLINAKKDPTLRQLMFANGMLKVIKERQFVIGFQTLGNLVSKEIGQPTMDTKAMKIFIQKLVTDKQLKILKIKWPGPDNKFSYLICAAHVKATDPIIKAKYKEICLKAQNAKKNIGKKSQESISRPLTQYTYPRYMKIQKLHEHITSLVYFSGVKNENLPPGFTTMFSIIPEMTVEFALGNISYVDIGESPKFKLEKDLLGTKLKDAPQTITKSILQSKSLTNSIRVSLKILAILGLIQIIRNPSSSLSRDESAICYVFYVNRHAKILNTTGRWPRSEDIKSLEKSFYFETFEDVKNYWNEVSSISSNTVINVSERERYKFEFPMRDEYDVRKFDTGERFGNGLGPCGFDSGIFMDVTRLWNTFLTRSIKKPIKKSEKPAKKKIKKNKKSKAKKDTDKSKKIKANFNLNKVKIENNRVIHTRKPKDSNILKWTPFEDKIIMFCKVAITIISSVNQAGCLKIRNVIAKDLLTLIDPQKTVSVCHKRAIFLESNSMWSHEKDCIISELRRRHNLIKSYEGILKSLKIVYCDHLSRLINEARVPMLELIWIIFQLEKHKTFKQETACVATDIEDFNKKYCIALSSENHAINPYKTQPSNALNYSALKEGILMVVMLSTENVLTAEVAQKVYAMFKVYPEPILRSAIDQLRKGGAIVPKEKSLNCQSRGSFDIISQSAFRISAFYRRKWINKSINEFFNELLKILDADIPTVGLKGRPDLNCLFCEMHSCDVIDIVSDTVPTVTGSLGSIIHEDQMNVIDMENKYKLKSGLLGWKNKLNIKTFSEFFNKIDCDSLFESMERDSIVTINTSKSVDRDNKILAYLDDMGFKGSTFRELQEFLSIDEKVLFEKLLELESQGTIKRIGYFQNKIMLVKYTKPLLLEVEPDKFIVPTPWLDLDGKIHRDVFFKWVNVILNKIFECPGSSLRYLTDTFECISGKSIQDICAFLEKCECVTLKTMKQKDVDLFSEDDEAIEWTDYNPYYFMENIFVFPVKNCLTKYVSLKRNVTEQA